MQSIARKYMPFQRCWFRLRRPAEGLQSRDPLDKDAIAADVSLTSPTRPNGYVSLDCNPNVLDISTTIQLVFPKCGTTNLVDFIYSH